MKSINTHKIHLFLAAALVFAMPLYQKALPPIITLMGINWLVERFRDGFKEFPAKGLGLSMIALYAFYALGLLWTDNLAAGAFDLEVKMSLAILPLFMITRPSMPQAQMRRVVQFFLLGLMVAISMCLIQSTYSWIHGKPGSYHFFDKYYSFHMHRGYFAMMLNLGVAAVITWLIKEGNLMTKTVRILLFLLAAWLSFSVIQTGSKNGILTLIVLFLILALWWMARTKRWLIGFVGFIIVAGGFLLMLKLSDRVYDRFERMWDAMQSEHDSSTIESTMLRTFAWESSLELISENPIVGVGTGDVKDKLLERYAQKGYTGAIKKNMNAHSQFFQTALALGIPGFVLLLLIFATMIRVAIRQKKTLLASFVCIMILYALSESVLEVQAGVVFFIFFALILTSGEQVFRDSKQNPDRLR